MRLVDVEPLDFISFQATGDTAYDQGFEDGARFVAEKLDASPTVDAIPVEWLRSQLKNNPNDIESAYDDICINELIDRWQKEQGAR